MPGVAKYNRALSKFAVVNEFLNQQELELVLGLEKNLLFNKDQSSITDKTDLAVVPADQNTQWLFDKFSALIGQVNHDFFMYDIDGFDNFQFMRVKKNGRIDWHNQVEPMYMTWERKIFASIMLTPSEEYLGGEHEVMSTGNPEDVASLKLNAGDVVFHAPWMSSRIVQITSGTRKTLNVWVMGKRAC